MIGVLYFYCTTYRESIEAVWHRLAAEFYTQGVFTCVLDCVIDAESSISIVFNIDVQVTETNDERIICTSI